MTKKITLGEASSNGAGAGSLASNLRLAFSPVTAKIASITGTISSKFAIVPKAANVLTLEPVFKVSRVRKNDPARTKEQQEALRAKLRADGSSDEQVDRILRHIDEEVTAACENAPDAPDGSFSTKRVSPKESDADRLFDALISGSTDPQNYLTLNVAVDASNVELQNLQVDAGGDAKVSNLDVRRLTGTNVSLDTGRELPFGRAEIDEVSMTPDPVPSLSADDIMAGGGTGPVTSDEMNLSMKLIYGQASLSLGTLEREFVWSYDGIGTWVLGHYIGYEVDLGVRVGITLHADVYLAGSNVALKVKGVVIDKLEFALELTNLALGGIKAGAAKLSKMVVET